MTIKTLIKENKFSTFLTIVTLILMAINFIFFSNLSYKSGLQGNAFYYFGRTMILMPFLLGGLAIVFIGAIINAIVTSIKAIKSKKLERFKLLLTAFPLFAIGGLFLYNMKPIGIPGAWHFLRGYEVWVGENVDIRAIQEWLMSLSDEYSEQSFFEATDFPEELPDAILKLDPYHMNFSEFKDGQRSVMFEWGCALGHFGIIIGLPSMETPEGEELIKHDEYDFEFRRPIEDGVYIFERG